MAVEALFLLLSSDNRVTRHDVLKVIANNLAGKLKFLYKKKTSPTRTA